MQKTVSPLVEMRHVTRTFPGVTALDGVNFDLLAGEVHVLFGENGAGKSTLISILAGVYPHSSGSVKLYGEEVAFSSVADAKKSGVSAVFQEFSLVPTLSVAKNIFLGNEPMIGPFIDRRRMERDARKLFAELGFNIDVRASVISLSRAEQQMTEIAKAIHANARILILDEPTASLTERETETLFRFIKEAKGRGVGVIYISHRIQEFSVIADRVTVLRDGKLIDTVAMVDTTSEKLIDMMTGREVGQIYPVIMRAAEPETVISIRDLRAAGVNGVDIDVRAGEVLGVAGLVGSGKSRAFRAALGLASIHAGKIELNGSDLTHAPTRRFLRRGVFYLPPDRKNEGLMLSATARSNINLGLLFRDEISTPTGISARRLNVLSSAIGRKVDLTDAYMGRPAANLSGGNQQKALFGKGFGQDYKVYIFDEPTVGVDMGTRAALYRLIKELAEAGKAVVVISSDLPEAMHLAHRLIVFANGKITAELKADEIVEGDVLNAFFKTEAA